MVSGYILSESMRLGSRLEELPLRLTRIERYPVKTAAADQPAVWTSIEFEFPEEEVERVARALAEVLEEHGGWYTNFTLGQETFVIFANRVFRYRHGDRAARAEVEEYGRSVGVPEPQLDWGD